MDTQALIDINTASKVELVEAGIPHATLEMIETLVEFRDENGPFGSWDDIKLVPGWSAAAVENLEDMATLGTAREERVAEDD